MSRLTRALSLPLVMLCLVVLSGCKTDDAAITTPSGGGLATPTKAPTRTATPTGTATAVGTVTATEAQTATAETIVADLVAQWCGGECPDGSGEFQPADIFANVPDMTVPPSQPAGMDLITGFLAPGSAGATVSSVKDTTVTFVYVSEDGEAWLTLAQGPDTRTAPAEGDEVPLSDEITAVLIPDPDGDETAGSLEWTDAEATLFFADWLGLSLEDATAFAEGLAA